ncbi:MAG: SDR family NAD(P)-dependent oxidoreductase [Elusimicrobia bacterium]|nr:SDR family NAD(P)-dependent oxidoreductase [Elusimicrobiota bacterium]
MKLKNKVAIITGGSGGIGKVIVRAFLKEGAKVVIAEINDLELKKTLGILKYYKKNTLIGVHADISNSEQVKYLVDKTISIYGTIDILVNVAGVQQPIGTLVKVDEKDWIENIKINIIGTMLCSKYVLPVMISKRSGKIINFSGGGATFPRPNFSAYASSKAAIVRFTETIAEESKEYGIDINTISPGSVYTNMLKEIIREGNKVSKNDYEEAIRIKKEGGNSPELSAKLSVFLASNESNGITGKLISAVWDNWRNFDKNNSKIMNSSLFTLRRVDGINIIESKKIKKK